MRNISYKLQQISAMILFLVFINCNVEGQTNTFPTTGNVGIGTLSPAADFSIHPPMAAGTNISSTFLVGTFNNLGNTPGSYLYPFEFQHPNAGNIDRLQFAPYRRIAGNDWPGTAYRIQFAVDQSFTDGSKAYVEIGGSDPSQLGGGFIAFGTSNQDRLVINSGGGVGIGTTAPTEALCVNGKIKSREIIVETSGWPDYVFEPKYKLPHLGEIKKYITQNHHLPNIPSAKEVAEKGIGLGDLNTRLLQKIEELTLHLIDLETKSNVQAKEILKLKNAQKIHSQRLSITSQTKKP